MLKLIIRGVINMLKKFLLLIFLLLPVIGTGCSKSKNIIDADVPLESVDFNALEYSDLSDFVYNKDSDHINILEYHGRDTVVKVPDMIEGLPVRNIGNGVFSFENKDTVRGIIYPENVKEIGSIFGNSSLEKIYLPSTLEKVSGYSHADHEFPFYGLPNLNEIKVADGCKNYFSVDGVLFCHMGIPSGTICMLCLYPSNKEGDTFDMKLEDTGQEDSFTISPKAFTGCKNIKKVIINDGVYSSNNSFNNIDCTYGGSIEELEVKNKSYSFGDGQFAGCTNLKKIIIPGEMSTPTGFDEVETFEGCTSLKEIVVIPPENPKRMNLYEVDDVLYSYNKSVFGERRELVLYPPAKEGEIYEVTEPIEEIQKGAVLDAHYLKKLVVPADCKVPYEYLEYKGVNVEVVKE